MSDKITFTIQSIRPPGEGKKSACITTTENEKLWLWADKLGLVRNGATYEAIVETNDRGFKNIKNVKQTAGPVVPFPQPQNAPRQQQPAASPSTKDKQIFVQGVLQHFIQTGQVKLDKQQLWNATQLLCDLWEHSRLNPGQVPYSEAAE